MEQVAGEEVSAPVGAIVEEAYEAALEILTSYAETWSSLSRGRQQHDLAWLNGAFGIRPVEVRALSQLSKGQQRIELVRRLEEHMPTSIEEESTSDQN